MQRVMILVPRTRRQTSSDRFEVFGDGGCGTVEMDRPISDAPVAFWPDSPVPAGHMRDGHLQMPHLDAVAPDGHLADVHLIGEHGWPARVMMFETGLCYFGAFRYLLRTIDGAGNVSEDEPLEDAVVVNSWPGAARSVTVSGYDASSDRVTLAFEPSPDLAG